MSTRKSTRSSALVPGAKRQPWIFLERSVLFQIHLSAHCLSASGGHILFKTLSITLVLSLSLLMVLPGTYSTVRALNQTGISRFSPFGPFTQQMIIHYYSDFNLMFAAFQRGEIDISDWQLETPNDINTFCSNADFFCTTAQDSQGYFGEEINSHPLFMGIALYQNRTPTPASFTTTATTPSCSTGFGSLSITLNNQENGTLVKDPLNTLTASNLPSGTPSASVSDSGGSTPNAVYNVPCILAGSYGLRTSIYGGTATVTVASNALTTGTFNVNWNSPSNAKPTQSRALFGAAISHLFDDPEFVSGQFGAVASAPCAFAAPSQGVTCPTQAQIDNAECRFGDHPWLNVVGCASGASGHDVGPYNIADDKIAAGTEWWNTGGTFAGVATGYSGHDDLRAACDDFVSMGLSLTPPSTTCNDVANVAAGPTDPGSYPHISPAGTGHIIDYIRTSNGRKENGQILADTLDFLFGTPMNRASQTSFVGTVCYGQCPQYTAKYYTFTQVTPCIFLDTPNFQGGCNSCPGSPPDCWQLYTAGHSFDPTPDQYFINRNSIQTGAVCAGAPKLFPNNYGFWCDPQTDTDSSAGEFAQTLPLSGQFFQRALLDDFNSAVDVPGFEFVGTFAENNGWNFEQCTGGSCSSTQSSIVNTVGVGTLAGHAYFTLLNARQVPGYNPCSVPSAPANCASYAPGGGNPNLIRRGFSQDTANLSPFTFNSVWEQDIITSIFDTMLQPNPNTGTGSAQLIDWGTTSHSSHFNPNEVGCNSVNGCATGVTTQIWHLRNDFKFSDGNSVTANDVAYTLVAYRDVPSSLLQSYVLNLVSATGLDCGSGQPCKTLQVKLQGQGALFEFNIGATQYILEKSLWAPYCGDPPVAGGTCASPTFDPMYPSANRPGIMVGTGPWACIAPTSGLGVSAGHVGGPCAEDATGALTGSSITTDGTVRLTENTNFVRCCPSGPSATSSSLYKISYADFHNTGIVDITDLANVASNLGTNNAYWCNVNIACTNGLVGAVNLATVAIYFGHGITYPYTPQTLVQVDPQIDPFFCPITGC